MPWFDETYFASMARNFLETGEFFPPICPMMDYYYPQSKAYGPAYFIVLSFVFKVFGFGIFQMRIPAIISGFLFILTGYKMLRNTGVGLFFSGFFVILLLFDPIFLQNIHSGRMDSMALLFAGLGSLQVLNGIRNNTYKSYVFAGLFMGIAILFTPRIAVNLFGAGLVAFLVFVLKPSWKNWLRMLLIPLLIVTLYYFWILWGFGGFAEAWNYYFGQPKEKLYYDNLAQGYISMEKYIPVFQYPALLILLALLGLCIFKRRPLPWVFWLSIFNLIGYFLLVRDTGIYSIFSMPWVYLCTIILANEFNLFRLGPIKIKWVLNIILSLNLVIFLVKNLVITLSASGRNDTMAYSQFSQIIPKGSRIIGDEVYYYLAVKSGSDFQYLDRGASGPQRLHYHLETYDFQYLIVREPVSNPIEFNTYFNKIPLKKVGFISTPAQGKVFNLLESFLLKIGLKVPAGYRGTVYKR